MRLQDIYEDLKNDLQLIEQELSETVASRDSQLAASAGHLLHAGGKRIRPVFVLLSGRFGQYDLERLKRIAVPLELIHMATLVHDDVIDDAETRRGRKTVRAQWDNRVAMYTGDFIFARALEVVSQIDHPRVHHILSRALVQMCRGEIEQIRDFYNTGQHLLRYLHRIKRKTALLMAISCQLGALASNASEEIVRVLYRYGYYVGMAFQITDDVLDLTGDERQLGKPAGSDLRQGNVTLPVIHTLQFGKKEDRERILAYLRSRGEEVSLDEVLTCVRHAEGIPFALNLAERYLEKALSMVEALPPCNARESLRMIARFVGTRTY
jgi:heptaprenyl diphosphate synthase